MKSFYRFLFILPFIFGCATAKFTSSENTRHRNHYYSSKSSENLQKGKVYYMVTSFYAKKFNGRKTASGEIYNMFDFTCAHKTLPFGTKLKVTNPDNNKSVVVRVNDRGPFVKGRDLDISYAAARKIGLIPYGFKKLKVEILK